MNTWLIKLITFLFALSLESCDFEGKYVHVCEGNYGSENVIDSIVQRYNFTNVHFAQSYKDYATPRTSNCDTINLVIQSDNSPVFYNDTWV